MSQLSEKELSALNDLLNEEDLLVKKFKMLAEQTQDTQIKSSFTEISSKHQGHFNDLYSHFN
ncbi:MAG: hypothetical protein RSD97_08065 [Lachnospiraceae bacterium]